MAEFETKRSGDLMQFESGMVRDTSTGKTMWDLTADGPMLKRWAELLTRGAVGDPNATPPKKGYGARNWMKASGDPELARFKESAFRHFMQWYRDERDEDHGAAVFFNINGAEYVRERLVAIPRNWECRSLIEGESITTPNMKDAPPGAKKADTEVWIQPVSRYCVKEAKCWYRPIR